MDTDEGQVEHGFGDEVAVTDGIQTVVEHAGETEITSVALRIDRQGRPGERPGAER